MIVTDLIGRTRLCCMQLKQEKIHTLLDFGYFFKQIFINKKIIIFLSHLHIEK